MILFTTSWIIICLMSESGNSALAGFMWSWRIKNPHDQTDVRFTKFVTRGFSTDHVVRATWNFAAQNVQCVNTRKEKVKLVEVHACHMYVCIPRFEQILTRHREFLIQSSEILTRFFIVLWYQQCRYTDVKVIRFIITTFTKLYMFII